MDLCPGSVHAQAGKPDRYRKSSVKGTAEHTLLENMLLSREVFWTDKGTINIPVEIDSDLTSIPESSIIVDGVEVIELGPDDINAVRVAYDYTQSKMGSGVTVYSEMKVDPGFYIERDDGKGTMDVSIIQHGHLEGVDYKGGVGVLVEVKDNLQLIGYMLGLLHLMVSEGLYVETVTMTIIQPHAEHPDGPIRSQTMTVKELLSWVPYVKNVLARTDPLDAPRVAGEAQCQFCKVKGTCPTLAEKCLKDAQATYSSLAQTTLAGVDDNLTKEPKELTVEQRSMVVASTSLIKGWLEAVNAYALSEELNGRPTPGFKAVRGSGSKRRYKHSDDVTMDKLLSQFKKDGTEFSLTDITESKLLSPKQLEKSIKSHTNEYTWKEVQKLIIKPEGGLSMVPISDPRPPVRKSAKEIFAPLMQKYDFLN